jgi:hypothetical protein
MMRQPDDAEARLEHFASAVAAYMTLRESVTQPLPPLEISPDFDQVFLAVDAMAAAISAARPSAKEGDIFDPETGALLRQRIRHALRAPGCDARGDPGVADGADAPATARRPIVHDRFDWGAGSSMSWCLLDVLPTLPEELQFRFVNRDLVLVDIDADLVVDVLPDALPRHALWRGLRYARLQITQLRADSINGV